MAGLKCSVSIDTIGKECLENVHPVLYKYKNCTSVPPLSLIDDVITVSSCSSDSVRMNATIQAKIQGKQLELGQKKCFQMHIGRNSGYCPSLTVHNKEMFTTNREKYLGEILSSSGKIDNNVLERYNKGVGIVNDILGLLKEVSFGYHHFSMALLFRNSKLVSGMLCSIETVYGLTNAHIEQLEQCDRMLLRKVFNCVSSTAIESYYLEANILPFRHIIIARRLMYYWTILQKSDSELVRQVFTSQQMSPVRNDWCLQVIEDLQQCDIKLDESEISVMKKSTFKQLVMKKVREVAKQYLVTLKAKHSKSDGLSEEYSLQGYLTTDALTTEEKQLLFQFRTRTFPCKTNYKKQHEPNLSCTLCQEEDSPEHLLQCSRITTSIDTSGVCYSDIFGSTAQQIRVTKVLRKVTLNRKKLLSQ